jgi:alpha-tubulin suppressor-like RCC1 family protein
MKKLLTLLALFSFSIITFSQTSTTVATGSNHTLAVNDDGTLWAWGENSNGQLGTGTTNDTSSPIQIGSDTNWHHVGATFNRSFGIKSDGTLWAWGQNNGGTLGDGTTTDRLSPVQIGTDTDWLTVSPSATHTIALKTDGTMWAWGSDTWGQLGTGNSSSLVPVQMGSDSNWVDIATAPDTSFGIKSDGTMWSWGYGTPSGSLLGYTTPSEVNSNPQQIGTDSDWEHVEAGFVHLIARKSDGSIYGWGTNTRGQLGNGTGNGVTPPTQIGTDTDWSMIRTGDYVSYGIKDNGSLYGWGFNNFGQISPFVSDNTLNVPTLLSSDSDWSTIRGGTFHTVAQKSDGTVWLFGNNYLGQLGVDTFYGDIPNPVNVSITGSANSISAGAWQSGFTTTDNNLAYFGFTNFFNPFFASNLDDTNTPTPINGDVNWQSISCGRNYNSAIKTDGTLWLWGIGVSSSQQAMTPYVINADTNWSRVYAGAGLTFAIKDGSLWAWGSGYIGNGAVETVADPVQVGTDTNWVKVSHGTGGNHIIGLQADGTIWSWGNNTEGTLGNGTMFTNELEPTMIGTDTDWIDVATGNNHSLALKSDGTLWGWGKNNFNQLNISSFRSLVPVQIGNANNWVVIADTMGDFSLGIQSDGTLWAWGDNEHGQAGVGTFSNVSTITQVGSDSDWFDIVGGLRHSVARKFNGEVWSWGGNDRGQLGVGNAVVSFDLNSLSVDDVQQPNTIISLYPNPSSSVVTIGGVSTFDSVEVYNLLGKKVDMVLVDNRINIESLQSGIYLVKIQYEGTNTTLRFVKK